MLLLNFCNRSIKFTNFISSSINTVPNTNKSTSEVWLVFWLSFSHESKQSHIPASQARQLCRPRWRPDISLVERRPRTAFNYIKVHLPDRIPSKQNTPVSLLAFGPRSWISETCCSVWYKMFLISSGSAESASFQLKPDILDNLTAVFIYMSVSWLGTHLLTKKSNKT